MAAARTRVISSTAAALSQSPQPFICFSVDISYDSLICAVHICVVHICMRSLVVGAGLPVPVITAQTEQSNPFLFFRLLCKPCIIFSPRSIYRLSFF